MCWFFFFAFFPCDLMIIFNVWIPFSFLCLCIYIDLWFVITMRFIYSKIYIHDYITLLISKFKHILPTLNFSPPHSLFQTYFTSIFFVYPLTTYYYAYSLVLLLLSFNLLVLYIVDLLPLWYICLFQWDFSLCNFHVSSFDLFSSA